MSPRWSIRQSRRHRRREKPIPGAGQARKLVERGTWRTPNITQDKGSEIGSWTDDQIGRGIREGVRPDGSQMYVIMPYMHFNRLTDDDTKALVAFLRTLPAISKVVAPNKDLKLMAKIPAPKPANAPDMADADCGGYAGGGYYIFFR